MTSLVSINTLNLKIMKLVIPLHSLYCSIHIKDESKCGTVLAFIFGVNWLWRCGVKVSFEVFFHELKCTGMTSFMKFMYSKFSVLTCLIGNNCSWMLIGWRSWNYIFGTRSCDSHIYFFSCQTWEKYYFIVFTGESQYLIHKDNRHYSYPHKVVFFTMYKLNWFFFNNYDNNAKRNICVSMRPPEKALAGRDVYRYQNSIRYVSSIHCFDTRYVLSMLIC